MVIFTLLRLRVIRMSAFFRVLSFSESFSLLAKFTSTISLKNESLRALILLASSGEGF